MPQTERVTRRGQDTATTATPTLRRNPEIDAKLDRFIEANPKLKAYYDALSKEELTRKLMLGKMQRQDYAEGRNNEIRSWVEEHPEVKARIEQSVRHVPEENRERAFINAARREATNVAIRGNGMRQ